MSPPGPIRAVVVAGVLTGMVLGASLPAWPAEPSRMARMEVAKGAPASVLTDQDDRRFALHDVRGKAVLMSFIYTSCPDVCPLIFRAVTAVQKQVKAGGRDDLVCAFVTTDPELDVPKVLKAYATRQGADLSSTTFLTGSSEELQAVWQGFGVTVRRRARGLVDHTPLTVLIDKRGVVRYRYLGGALDTKIILDDSWKILGEEVGPKRPR